MKESLADEIADLADQADNLLAASKLPLTPQTHAENLGKGMEDIRDTLRRLYIREMGDNPWEE